MSESSLTSSLASDAGSPGQPRKRILKKPHGPRKHKSNRVHWNIPEEGGGGDGVSLLSFESTSTASGVSPCYSASESRRQWREFEEAPPPGSTGLTPIRQPPLAPLREQLGESVDSTPSLSPGHARIEHRAIFTQRTRQTQSLPFYSTPSGSGVPHHTSTPLRHHSNSSTPSTTSTHKTAEFHVNGAKADSTSSSQVPPPVLRLDHSNLSELEASSLQDRVRSNLFEFPPVTKGSPLGADKTPAPPSYSGYIPPEGQAHLCGGSDADDYDHLSPQSSAPPPPQTLAVANRNSRFDYFPQPSKTRLARLSSPPLESKVPEKPPTSVKNSGAPFRYRENDIDEALNELTDSASSRSGSSAPQSPLLDLTGPLMKLNLASGGHENNEGEVPPPIPPKLRRRKSDSPTTSSRPSSSPLGGSEGRKFPTGPPEFATGPAHPMECGRLSPEEGGHDDALSSVSTATLVPSEPGDHLPPSTHSGQIGAVQRTKPNHFSKFGGGASTTDYTGMKTRPSVRVHPETFQAYSSSAPTHQSWDPPQWKESGFAPHPPPLPHQQPPLFTYPHESQLYPIEEGQNPERQALISVSNSGSDSSLRGASPPEKISQTSVIPTNQFDRNFYSEDSLSQPLPARPLSASTRGVSISTPASRGLPKTPQFSQNPPPAGGGMMSRRNHRLYHSHRSGLAPRPRHQKIPANFPAGRFIPPQPVPSNSHRRNLKFQYSLDSLETPSEEVPALTRTYSPPFQSMALSQDDPPLGTSFNPLMAGGLVGGRGLLPRPRFRSTDGINQKQLLQNYPYISQGHAHKPHPPQRHAHRTRPPLGHTHQPHPLHSHRQKKAHVPQLLKQAHSMTSV